MNTDELKIFFSNLNLPLSRGKLDIVSFLKKNYAHFNSELTKLLISKNDKTTIPIQITEELKMNKEKINEFCKSIITSIEFYIDGRPFEAYKNFNKMMNDVQNYLLIRDLREGWIQNRYFRIRPEKVFRRKDLFHIPFNEVTKIKASRYSIAGFPCLYLGGSKGSDTGLFLCWLECGMPYEFTWSEYKLTNDVPITLIDLSISPFFSAITSQQIITSLLNSQDISQYLLNIIFTYPLVAACSLIADDKGQNFTPEYITPQMLLQWVRQSEKVKGIAYYSCSNISNNKRVNAFNIVLAPITYRKNGYCEELSNEFLLSRPEYVDITKILKSKENRIIEIIGKRNELNQIQQKSLGIQLIIEMISLCDSFSNLYYDSVHKYGMGMKNIYQYMVTLRLQSDRLANEESLRLIEKEAKSFLPHNSNVGETCKQIFEIIKTINKNINEIMEFFNEVVKNKDYCFKHI